MKTHMRKGILGVFFAAASLMAFGQNQYASNIEVPGDHFSLEGALELFKKSSSPEEFERLLNVPDSKVNNLDLNGDRQIDYIKVIDRYDRDVHAFILQAVISERELQDIAVITLEKHSDGRATLQIVGDADIYGVETIIEPTEEVRVYAGTTTSRNVVNVWTWPVVQYVYAPTYSVWISPWGWYSRPIWWYPWRPVTYVVYRPYWEPYRVYYSTCYYHRNVYAQRIYYPVRTTSVIVYNRHHDNIVRSRNTRGRDYDRNGYYRADERARYARDARVQSYDNSRDYTRRERSAGYDNNTRGNNSSNSNRPERSNYNRGRDERNNSNDQENSTSIPNDRGNNGSQDRGNFTPRTNVDRGRDDRNGGNDRNMSIPNVRSTSESRPTFSVPRNTRDENSRPRVEVSRSSGNSERHQVESVPRVRSSQGNDHSGGARMQSMPQQRNESPRVSSPGNSQRSERVSPAGSSHSGSSGKRGRD